MVPAVTNEEETSMSYETRINSLAEEAAADVFNAAYDQEKDRLLDTDEGSRELQAAIRQHYGNECVERLRAARDAGNDDAMDAVMTLRQFARIVVNKMAVAKAHERMKEIAEHNEDMMSDWGYCDE